MFVLTGLQTIPLKRETENHKKYSITTTYVLPATPDSNLKFHEYDRGF